MYLSVTAAWLEQAFLSDDVKHSLAIGSLCTAEQWKPRAGYRHVTSMNMVCSMYENMRKMSSLRKAFSKMSVQIKKECVISAHLHT